MNIENNLDDTITLMMYEAHEYGAIIKSHNSTPCSICKEVKAMGQDDVKREHFHGSDFGACARKTFKIMRDGHTRGSSNSVFLMDGHLHEHSMLSNLIAGLPDGWSVKAMENTSEKQLNVLGFTIIGHVDALLINSGLNFEDVYLIECKSVKDYTFKKVKAGEISNEWYGQIHSYMLMMETGRTYLMVKHRETSKLLPPIRVDINHKYVVERLNILKDIHTRLVNGMEQPNREHKTSKDSECKFCPFGNEIGDKSCWGMKESD